MSAPGGEGGQCERDVSIWSIARPFRLHLQSRRRVGCPLGAAYLRATPRSQAPCARFALATAAQPHASRARLGRDEPARCRARWPCGPGGCRPRRDATRRLTPSACRAAVTCCNAPERPCSASAQCATEFATPPSCCPPWRPRLLLHATSPRRWHPPTSGRCASSSLARCRPLQRRRACAG